MFINQNPLPLPSLHELLSDGDTRPPAEPHIIERKVSETRFNTLVLLAVAVGRERGIGSPAWVRFGALTAAEIGYRVWDVKSRAVEILVSGW